MICPKCKTEIKEGFLYCPKCGEEIIMVPDYVENKGVEDALSEMTEIIADEVLSTMSDENNHNEKLSEQYRKKHKADSDSELNNDKPFLHSTKFFVIAIVSICLVFSLGIYKLVDLVNDYYSFDVQYAKSEVLYLENDYENCIKQLKHVISIDDEVKEPRLLIADCYYALEKYDEAIAALNSALEKFPDDISIYEHLLLNYEAENDIKAIVELSKICNNKSVAGLFEDYISAEPEFSIDEGTLFAPESLRLIGKGNGDIYYTLDGTEPTLSSNKYKSPIRLYEGTTNVSAIYVNENGIVSNSVSKVYNVEVIKPSKPKVLTTSGKYSVPRLIKVSNVENGTLYYTTDGSEPTVDSKKFTPPVAMPLGKSEFRFVVVDDSGNSSDVVVEKYELTLQSVIDVDMAQGAVSISLMAIGVDVSNHKFVAKYGYSLAARTYYLVEDYIQENGKDKKQNVVYAVDAQSGTVFKVTPNSSTGDYDFGTLP